METPPTVTYPENAPDATYVPYKPINRLSASPSLRRISSIEQPREVADHRRSEIANAAGLAFVQPTPFALDRPSEVRVEPSAVGCSEQAKVVDVARATRLEDRKAHPTPETSLENDSAMSGTPNGTIH